MCRVARTEEAFGAAEQVTVMFMPANAASRAERLLNLRLVAEAGGDDLKGATEENGTCLCRQRQTLLRRKDILPVSRVVGDVSSGGVRIQPLPDIALVGSSARCQLSRRKG